MKIAADITELIGNTPLVQINNLNKGYANIYAKLECFNPANSIKDRVALNMIHDAEKKGLISPDKTTLIEPTSGNTGIGLAYIASIRGYKIILTMPDTMSVERRMLLKAYGAELVLTDGKKGMQGAIDKANELAAQIENSYILKQFNNLANVEAHEKTTALEIWNDTDGKVDIVVATVGTGGTITGIAKKLKEFNSNIKLFAVEPAESAVLSGCAPNIHKIQGIGAGFIPEILELSLIDEIIPVTGENSILTARKMARTEGILGGFSSGAAMYAALELSKRSDFKNLNIVVILPDYGERYLSSELFAEN